MADYDDNAQVPKKPTSGASIIHHSKEPVAGRKEFELLTMAAWSLDLHASELTDASGQKE